MIDAGPRARLNLSKLHLAAWRSVGRLTPVDVVEFSQVEALWIIRAPYTRHRAGGAGHDWPRRLQIVTDSVGREK